MDNTPKILPQSNTVYPVPEPGLTPDEMVARARGMRDWLRDEQQATEERSYYSEEMHEAFKKAGFYRILQPKMFGGYEFDVETFFRVIMEVARGCPSTGWGLCLGASHVLQAAAYFSLETQKDIFQPDGHFVAAARDIAGGTVRPSGDGYVIDGVWHYCSGSPYSTHFLAHATIADADGNPDADGRQLLVIVPRAQWTLLDRWRGVHGMRGSGSHSIQIDNAFVPKHYAADMNLWEADAGAKTPGSLLHGNPMYGSRPLGFFHGEIASIITGVAYAAIDEYERVIRTSKAVWPFPSVLRAEHHEYQRVLGLAIGQAMAAKEAVLGGAREFTRLCKRQGEGGAPFSAWEDLALYNQQAHAARLSYSAIEHLVRMSGSGQALRNGQRMERYSRDAATYRSHAEGSYVDIFAEELGRTYLAEGGAL